MEQTINVERIEYLINVFGSFDENIKIIERELGVHVIYRDTEIKVVGDPERLMLAVKVIEGLLSIASARRSDQFADGNVCHQSCTGWKYGPAGRTV